jgi:hypothetical protein
MVMDHYVEPLEHIGQSLCELPVGCRWQRAAARMIMGEDYRGGPMFKTRFGHLPRENGGPVYASLLNLLDGDQFVLAVKREHTEYFVSLSAECGLQV